MSAAAEFSWRSQNVEPQGRSNEPRTNDLRTNEALESMGRLTGGVAHDFNNMLTGVLLYCDLMLEVLDREHPARKYVEEIRCAGLQAASLVRQLLLLARPATAEALPICLNEILGGMRSLLDHLIGENIRLQFHLEPELGAVVMGSAHARQIILNLVLNARDAARAEGFIKVQTCNARLHVVSEKSGAPNPDAPGPHASGLTGPGLDAPVPCVLLVVEDNGCGMSAETRSRLFKGQFTTKPAERGTGLGLTTVGDIVRSLGGLIKLDSAPGCGTRVTVILPQFQLAPSTQPSAASGKIANFSSENPANKKEE